MKNKKVRPPLRYPGSKFRAYKHIAPFIESVEHDEYREPFFGSGAVFFQKKLAKFNWINDLDDDLINTYIVMQDKVLREELINRVKTVIPSKDYFNTLKQYTPTDSLERAFRYFVINRTAYGGIMNLPNWGFHLTKSVQPDKWPSRIEEAGKKLEYAKITSLDYEKVLFSPKQGSKLLYFVDPPYYKADQKRAYKESFEVKDHIKLAECLKKIDSYFVLTYDDCEEVRELYNWAYIHETKWMYHTANAVVTTRKIGKELIITNFISDIK